MRRSLQVRWVAIALLGQLGEPAFGSADGVAVAALTGPEYGAERAVLDSQAVASRSAWSSRAEAVAGSHRWSLSRGAFEIGMRADALQPAERRLAPSTERLGTVLPTVSVGLHDVGVRRASDTSSLIARASLPAERDMTRRRVGIEWKPPPPRWNVGRDGLAVRLQGNDRMTMRVRNGVLAIYAQRTF